MEVRRRGLDAQEIAVGSGLDAHVAKHRDEPRAATAALHDTVGCPHEIINANVFGPSQFVARGVGVGLTRKSVELLFESKPFGIRPIDCPGGATVGGAGAAVPST